MIQASLSVFIASSLIAGASQVAEKHVAPPSAPTSRVEAGPGDTSWYPHSPAPPFLGELFQEEREDLPEVIYPGNAVFTVEDTPRIPAALEKPLERGGFFEPGYFIVHFETEVRGEDKALLDQLTGRVARADGSDLARWYVPNNSLVAWVGSSETYAALEVSDRVDWLGRYQPAYKLDPTIGTLALTSPERVGRAFYRLNVDLIPGHNPAAARTAINALGASVVESIYLRGAQTYDVSFLVVDAAPETVTRIASIEGVRMIQEHGDGVRMYDLSGGGKLQNRTLSADDEAQVPVINASTFPLWLTHNLQGQGQLIGVVDSSLDWNNSGTSGCNFGYPDTAIDNYGFALPNLAQVLLGSVGSGGVNLKVPRADILGGATLQGTAANEHGVAAAGAALADFYGNNENKWWEHDPDTWDSWAPTNYSGLLGPGIAHEAQLYFTPVMDSNDGFRWETFGEFETHMNTTLDNMAAAGVCASNHSVGLAEAANTYTQVSVTHDVNAFDNPNLLQCMAAGNDGATANALGSQAVVKNALCVGASDDVLKPNDRVTFSSIGPRFDGARKPDIMTPGSDTFGRAGGVQSLLILPDTNGTSSASCSYQYTAGTSFSSPIAAGAAALIHQYFEEGRYGGQTAITDPSAALMKSMLINAGTRLTGANLGNGQFPNDYQGWGEPNLSDVLVQSGSRNMLAYDVSSASGFTGSGNANDTYSLTVGTGEPLKISLAWTDEPGSAGSGKKLINDLNLRVESPIGTVYRGNVFNGTAGTSTTGGSADTLNNVESFLLNSPSAGTWTVTVDPGAGNYSVGQGYALVVTGDVTEGGGGPVAPVANFSGSPTSGTAPLNVNFSDTSTGSVTSWSWNFGDGGTSSAQNPSHTYTNPGNYTVTLTATGPGGSDGETKTNYISVNEPAPVAEFSGTPTSGQAPLAVNFSDASTGNVTSWSWNFGDGGTSSAQNPSHTYTSAGNYTVTLTATGLGGSDGETKTNYISVSSAPVPPVAEFSGSPTSGTAPLAVNFTDLSSGDVTGWSWTFGDGGTSSAQNPSHSYTSVGTYTVTLTASGPAGSDGETKTGYITVSNSPTPPTANFSGSPTSGTAPLAVNFTDSSTGDVTGWSWTFGDGGTSSAQNPSHTYTSAGSYTVSLTASGPGGSDGETKTGYIAVNDPPSSGAVYYMSFLTTTTVPGLGSVRDEDIVTYDPSTGSWAWYFDGSDVGLGSTDINAFHILDDGSIVMSFNSSAFSVAGLVGGPSGTTVEDSDMVLFTFSGAAGSSTSGSFDFIFDGSDVGLTTNGEDIDAVYEFPGGGLAISTLGTANVPGLTGRDEDAMFFSATQFGSATIGTWSLHFDGSDVGFSDSGNDDIGAVTFEDGIDMLFSTAGTYVGAGGTGADEDVSRFTGTFGSATSGSASLVLDLSALGISTSEDVDGLCFR